MKNPVIGPFGGPGETTPLSIQADAGQGPMYGVPLDEQKLCWEERPKDSRPESHPAVAPFTQRPTAGVEFEILGSVEINKTWQDQSLIQCNICRRQHKFGVKAGFVASYDDGWWYIVGPQCGGEDYSRSFSRAFNRHRRARADALATEDMRRFLSHRSEWLSYLSAFRDPVDEAHRLWTYFNTNEPDVFMQLKNAAKNGGSMRLSVDTGKRDRWGDPVYSDVKYGVMKGGAIFASDKPPARLWRDVETRLSPLFSLLDPEDLDRQILDWDARGTLKDANDRLHWCLRDLAYVQGQLEDAAQFVTPENIRKIIEWSRHPDSFCPPMQCEDAGDGLVVMRGTRSERRLPLSMLRSLRFAKPY